MIEKNLATAMKQTRLLEFETYLSIQTNVKGETVKFRKLFTKVIHEKQHKTFTQKVQNIFRCFSFFNLFHEMFIMKLLWRSILQNLNMIARED